MESHGSPRYHRKLIDSLYVEAMVLADEARTYFDELGREERDTLDALTRVAFSCESLKVTTRLMHIIAWLLTQRAVQAGEISENEAMLPSRRLGTGPETDPQTLAAMPPEANAIIVSSIDLHRRVARFDAAQDSEPRTASPAHDMLRRLASAF
jgi:regulator of CtrA degradation